MENFNAQNILNERTHSGRGEYCKVAPASQAIKTTIEEETSCTACEYLTDEEHEAMDCIAMKLARIIHRTSKYDLDSWQDIAGYATLVVNSIHDREAKK